MQSNLKVITLTYAEKIRDIAEYHTAPGKMHF